MMENTSNRALEEYRERIADIDREICRLFSERLETAGLIAEYKKENALPVYDPAQESKRMSEIEKQVPDDQREYIRALYELIFEISKDLQKKQIEGR